MAWTQDEIDALEDAIAKGILEVEYEDKRIKYRNLDDMMRTLTEMKKCVGSDRTGVSGRVFMAPSKGLVDC